jgi:hypothetical protein
MTSAEPDEPDVELVRDPARWAAACTSAAWRTSAPAVSVVVATRNRAAMLAGLLDRLARQEPPPGGFEVVVVDDASEDETWSTLRGWLEATALPAAAVRRHAPGGQAEARTDALAVVRGTVVACTDDDCLPAPTWAVNLTAPLRRRSGPVAAQGRTVPWTGDTDAGPWDRTVWVLRPTWLFETCNVAYRTAALRRAGGFVGHGPAPTGPHGRIVGEDALAGWRVLEREVDEQGAGGYFAFVPGALVHHRHHPATWRGFVAEQRGRGMFPALVGASPFGRLALWHRWFLASRTAAFDLAVAGVVVGLLSAGRRSRRWALVAGAVVPWTRLAWREAGSRSGAPTLLRLGQVAVADAVGGWACWRGSWRWREPVL